MATSGRWCWTMPETSGGATGRAAEGTEPCLLPANRGLPAGIFGGLPGVLLDKNLTDCSSSGCQRGACGSTAFTVHRTLP